MFNKFLNLFRNNSILQANIFKQIEDYLVDNEEMECKLKIFPETVTAYGFCVPDSFGDDLSIKKLKNSVFSSSYEMVNTFYKRVGVGEIDLKNIDESVGYWYVQIIFFTEAINNPNKYIKFDCHNFLITLVNLHGEKDEFKMMYYKGAYTNYIDFFTSAEFINPKKPKNNLHKFAIENLEKVVYGICKKIDVPIPSNIQSSELDNLLVQSATLEDIIALLKLISRNTVDEKLLNKNAKKFFNFYKKQQRDIDLHDFFRLILEDLDIAHYSDWKFDPEDIEYYVATILDEDFTFENPEDTYGSDLFPIVQKELKKTGKVLMNVQTFGDSYLYIVVNSSDVNKLLQYAKMIDLRIEAL